MGNERDFKRFMSHDQDDHHAHIYGKNLLLWNQNVMTLKLGKQHWLLEYYQIYSNDDPGLTLTYFTARSNVVPFAFVWENA